MLSELTDQYVLLIEAALQQRTNRTIHAQRLYLFDRAVTIEFRVGWDGWLRFGIGTWCMFWHSGVLVCKRGSWPWSQVQQWTISYASPTCFEDVAEIILRGKIPNARQ